MIKLQIIEHKGQKRIAAYCQNSPENISLIKSVSGYRFSASKKVFHYPYSAQSMELLKQTFPSFTSPEFNLSLSEKEKKPATNQIVDVHIKKFKYWLRSRRYSENTIGTYCDAAKTFLKFFDNKPLKEITNDDVILFNNKYILAKQFSASFQNQIVNAVKLFFSTVEGRQIEIERIHRPKNPRMLPNVLSKEEVKLILNAHGNIKHRAMLCLIYSCGLRCGELINLKLTDLDSKRNLLIIRQAKGKKDRVAPLSDKTIEMLRQYYTVYKPVFWLFEGQKGNCAYDERSLGYVLKQALQKTGIKKPVTLHWLRHSYATHLLENGTNLRYIQEILGHSSSRTTEIYTHVSNHSLQKIQSPFDSL